MSPCALVSLPARPSYWKALPPAVNGGRNPTWGGGPQFTVEFAADDLLPLLNSSPQQPASSFPSESPFPASPLSSTSADYISSTAATLLSSASSAAASPPPRGASPPRARASARGALQLRLAAKFARRGHGGAGRGAPPTRGVAVRGAACDARGGRRARDAVRMGDGAGADWGNRGGGEGGGGKGGEGSSMLAAAACTHPIVLHLHRD
ncbi:unnamed protein product [Closterium sp. NIES-54]